MRNTVKSFIVTIVALFGFVALSPAAVTFAASGSADQACAGLQAVDPTVTCDSSATSEKGIDDIIGLAVKWMSIIAGIIAVIMLIVGGLKYITSNGDSNSISSAKKTIIYAIVGLVVVAISQIIVRFAITQAK